ncbi:MAG: hypothetical protein KIG36_06795 [Eubacteriales bacterium]|nr:hypothetical protein [Eubacteriales bacterium]
MLYLIVNPNSGHGRGSKIAALADEKLTAAGVGYQLLYTQGCGHATVLARECCTKEDCTGVAVIGGDGTMNEALSGFDTGKGIPFGIVPGGTGNDLNRSLHGKKEVEEILDEIIKGQTKRVDYLEVSGRRCLNVASIGFDVTVLEHYNRYTKRLHGSYVYDLAVLRTLLDLQFKKAHVVLDDGAEEFDCRYTLVAGGNGKYYGGGIPVTPRAELDDGKMDLCLVRDVKRIKILGVLLKFMKGKHCDEAWTVYQNCSRVRVVPEKGPVMINVDGQLFEAEEFDCRLIPGGLLMYGE